MFEHKYSYISVEISQVLCTVPLRERLRMWWQQDGAPPHGSLVVRNHLHDTYPNKWIGRGGPFHWPARSPDLTPLDFFLWGHLKQVVYAHEPEEPEDPDHLRQLITEACQAVTPQMLQRARLSVIRRAEICINQGGQHFEHLLN